MAVSDVRDVGELTTVSSSPSNSTSGKSDGVDRLSGGKRMFLLVFARRVRPGSHPFATMVIVFVLVFARRVRSGDHEGGMGANQVQTR